MLEQYTAKSPDDDIPQIFVDNLELDIKEIYNKFANIIKTTIRKLRICHKMIK